MEESFLMFAINCDSWEYKNKSAIIGVQFVHIDMPIKIQTFYKILYKHQYREFHLLYLSLHSVYN